MYRSKYRNLVIIGNGFDRWNDLPTSYDNFKKYYAEHIDKTMDALGIDKEIITAPDGTEKIITPVELVYGDPFAPDKLPSEFFWNFETSLDQLDDQQLNLYYGRSKEGIHSLKETVKQAQTILRRLFSSWVLELNITAEDSGRYFKNDCFFVNFNYTDTLEKRFGVNEEDVYYIHGDARHPESIVFGHATHPETAFRELIEQHFIRPLFPEAGLPRLEGLYTIEEALYQTDKHVADHIDLMCRAFVDAGIYIEEIENIYVLGHSFGDPDVEYFDYIDKVTRCGCNYDSLSAAEMLDIGKLARLTMSHENDAENLLLDEIQRNIRYATHHRERKLGKADISFPVHEGIEKLIFDNDRAYDAKTADDDKRSVQQRFLFEQAGRTQELLKEMATEYGLPEVPEGCHSVLGLCEYLDGGHTPRKKNAQWHISYFTPEDKKRIEKAMKHIGLKRYHLYEGIDQCLLAHNRDRH